MLTDLVYDELEREPATAEELAVRMGLHVSVVRHLLAKLLFDERRITCVVASGSRASTGKYFVGDPEALLTAA